MSIISRVPGGRFGLLACVILLFLPVISSARNPSPLVDGPVVTLRSKVVLSERTRKNLTIGHDGMTKVWVFFTDKGITSKSGFERVASTVRILPRAGTRRAKVGMNKVLFADLPVYERYIEEIESLGAKHRRSSRWLNGASFLIPVTLLDSVAALPQVAEIKPLGLFRRDTTTILHDLTEAQPSLPQSSSPNSPGDLIYGPSFTQLRQIGVPLLHARGYTGKGVTLAIFDTGFRKDHEAFAQHFLDNRVLAEFDFVFNDSNTANEPSNGDRSDQWNHGTYIWSVAGGNKNGTLFGPAYEANFILCKTEDIRSETPVEEDNWVAALEWSSSLGADVVTSSVGYIAWYTFEDLDGQTAVITQAANIADSLGIVVCNAMGNFGARFDSTGSLIAPADAFNILAVGAVSGNGAIASFSSRGPTFDGRIKPEVVAMGVGTFAAEAISTDSYDLVSGTSLSTPLVAGAVCQLIQARPQFTPAMIRQAILETASQSDNPDNTFGWGLLDIERASFWGINIAADTLIGNAPLSVQFTGGSPLNPTAFLWDFGDGTSSQEQNPNHTYTLPGAYTISLQVTTDFGLIDALMPEKIIVLGDTVWISGDSSFAGQQVVLSVSAQNSQPLSSIILPIEMGGTPFALILDSATAGSRSGQFSAPTIIGADLSRNKLVLRMVATDPGDLLTPGVGEIMKLYLKIDQSALGGLRATISSPQVGGFNTTFQSDVMEYAPLIIDGWAATKVIQRGDVDYSNDGVIDIADLSYLISYIFLFQAPPVTRQSGDVNGNGGITMADIIYLIDYLFLFGPLPPSP